MSPRSTLSVFLCSTHDDLEIERAAILKAVRELDFRPGAMEFFGARSDVPLETCLEEVRSCDALLVVVGHMYGTFIPDGDISYSEAEYNEGYENRKPCLVYMRREDIPVLPRHVETRETAIQALASFKKTLRDRHTVFEFKHAEDLAEQVAVDLTRTLKVLDDVDGTAADGDKSGPEAISEELNTIVRQSIDNGVNPTELFLVVGKAVAQLTRDTTGQRACANAGSGHRLCRARRVR